MALAATWRPRGRLRSVMARTTLGLDMADTFTSSDTCQTDRQTDGGRRAAAGWARRRGAGSPEGTHGGEGHELQDAAAAALLQAVHALLHEPLHELRVGAGGPRAQDGGDEQEQVGCAAGGRGRGIP